MDGKAFQWNGSQVYEIGWAAYLTRKLEALAMRERPRSFFSSVLSFFRHRMHEIFFRCPLAERESRA
jgi:hypothetical protein